MRLYAVYNLNSNSWSVTRKYSTVRCLQSELKQLIGYAKVCDCTLFTVWTKTADRLLESMWLYTVYSLNLKSWSVTRKYATVRCLQSELKQLIGFSKVDRLFFIDSIIKHSKVNFYFLPQLENRFSYYWHTWLLADKVFNNQKRLRRLQVTCPTSFISQRFKGYSCKSGMLLNK